MKIPIGSRHANDAKRILASALICGALLALPACGIPALRPPKPGLPPPQRFNLPHPVPGADLPAANSMATEKDKPAQDVNPPEVIQTAAEEEQPSVSPAPAEAVPEAAVPEAVVPEAVEESAPAENSDQPEVVPAPAAESQPAENSSLPEVFPGEGDQGEFPEDPNAMEAAANVVGEGAPAENSARVKVEEFFKDPRLSILINEALIGNYELKGLAEEIQLASNEFWGRTGAYLPFLRSAFTLGIERLSDFTPLGVAESQLDYLPGKSFPAWPANFLAAGNISWQVDIWRQLRNARDATRLRYFATSEGRNFIVTRLVADIAENYYKLMALDARLENLNDLIRIQEQSLQFAQAAKEAARGNELAVQRFTAEVRKNQSEKLIVTQDIIETENQINFLLGRYPQPVDRQIGDIRDFVNLRTSQLNAGLPAQLLQNRPDIRQAEREVSAAGLDINVARANFYPRVALAGPMGPEGPFSPIGWQAFNMKYLFFTPESLVASIAGDFVTPILNKRAIQAEFQNANARQLQSLYKYQQTILDAYTEVYNRLSRVERFARSVEIKKRQVTALEKSVGAAMDLFQNPRGDERVDYLDVLTAQNELLEARMILIDTKSEQLSAMVNAYQALGGGGYLCPLLDPMKLQPHHNWFTGKFHARAGKVLPAWIGQSRAEQAQ